MFGESESESPRVPSPWDSLISSPPSPAPKGRNCPSPLSLELIPQLVPESDDGNVEYKLQLLNPSPARFARLVTQMKWRLLEGGGQAYYELGVADSGHLVGLPRDELEQSLETLEMMAGEIGASVIVVKEIEVPEVLVDFAAAHSKDWGDGSGKRSRRREALMVASEDGGYSTSTLLNTETETDSSTNSVSIVSGELDESEDADDELFAPMKTLSKFSIDIEIASVYKPRPMKVRMHHRVHHPQTIPCSRKSKRPKKHKFHHPANTHQKAQNRRQYRDTKREEKRKTLLTVASHAVQSAAATSTEASPAANYPSENTDELVSGLGFLHVDVDVIPDEPEGDDDDVFASPITAKPSFTSFKNSTGESHLDVDVSRASALTTENDKIPRLIVEALVVRKMSLEEAFLDFGGFSLI
ncbi:hypothetical protein BDQ17DRAFT_1230822 [Cyathus striatus]|nr:hypothetical protein BDQ17DRAFT_1230822 [Cyathus striatus]